MTERIELIRKVLAEALAPMVHAEGGALYLVAKGERELNIHLTGRYSGSPAASLLHEEFVLPLIESVAPGTDVQWTSGRLIPADAELIVPPVPPTIRPASMGPETRRDFD